MRDAGLTTADDATVWAYAAAQGLRMELLAVVDLATVREPGARYPTARKLAEDLRRYQTAHSSARNVTRCNNSFTAGSPAVRVAAIATTVLLVLGTLPDEHRGAGRPRREPRRVGDALLAQRTTEVRSRSTRRGSRSLGT